MRRRGKMKAAGKSTNIFRIDTSCYLNNYLLNSLGLHQEFSTEESRLALVQSVDGESLKQNFPAPLSEFSHCFRPSSGNIGLHLGAHQMLNEKMVKSCQLNIALTALNKSSGIQHVSILILWWY